MSFDNYTELKKSIIKWSKRDDLDLLIDDFIRLAETNMFKSDGAHEALEIRGEETTSTASITTKNFALPDNYHSWRSIALVTDNNNNDLLYKAPNALFRRPGTGKPRYFTIGSQVELDITPDQAYTVEVNYYKKPAALSSTNATNIVLDDHPDIYLNGALYFLFKYAQDSEQANAHQILYIDAINGANQSDRDGRYGPAPYARIDGPTP
ncbi:MAG: phage adaptor protein [Marinomonas sp.]